MYTAVFFWQDDSGYQRVCGIAAPCKSVLLYHYLVREAFALAREMLHKR